jgi:hypothetical protein
MDNLAALMLLQIPAPAGFDFPLVTALTGFMALPVKFLVDVVKGWNVVPGSLLPVIGIVIGYVFCIIVLIAAKTPFDSAVYAQCGIAAVGAQIAAMAATWNQNRAEKVEERVQTALDLPQGSSKADVNAKVFKENQ